MRVRDVMTTPVIVTTPESTIGDIAALMLRNRVTALPVVELGKVIGIVTESDLVSCGVGDDELRGHPTLRGAFVELIRGRPRWLETGVRCMDLMTRTVTTADPEELIGVVADRMVSLDRKHLPVIEEGRLVGIVSRIDLLRGWIQQQREVAS